MLRRGYMRLWSRQAFVSLVGAACVVFLLSNAGFISPPEQIFRHRRTSVLSTLPGIRGDNNVTFNTTTFVKHPSRCSHLPNIDDIVILIKTGATEAFEKLPIQLLTFIQCVEDKVLIFSDIDQEIGPYHVYDALDEVNPEAKMNNPDFDLYLTQQSYKIAGIEVSRTLKGAKANAAWNLDKYKNIHIAKKAYTMRPDAKWYIYIDADSYVVLPSLLRWLERLDPTEPAYMGSKALINEVPFAHGGSGYVLSASTMKKFVGDDPGVASRWDLKARHECCGDLNLANAVHASGAALLLHVWPMINGENPRTLPFGPSHWCQPIVTMHHVTPEEANDMWWYEQQRPDPSVSVHLISVTTQSYLISRSQQVLANLETVTHPPPRPLQSLLRATTPPLPRRLGQHLRRCNLHRARHRRFPCRFRGPEILDGGRAHRT
jgi:hypothetical protein